MAKLKSTTGKKARYGVYKLGNHYSKNKERKLLKHMLAHPNDTQAEKAEKNIPAYSRKAVHSSVPKYTTIIKKTKAGKSYSTTVLSKNRMIKPTPLNMVNGLAVILDNKLNAMQLALQEAA